MGRTVPLSQSEQKDFPRFGNWRACCRRICANVFAQRVAAGIKLVLCLRVKFCPPRPCFLSAVNNSCVFLSQTQSAAFPHIPRGLMTFFYSFYKKMRLRWNESGQYYHLQFFHHSCSACNIVGNSCMRQA